MKKSILHIGLDVDDKAFHAFGVCEKTGECFSFACSPNTADLIKKLTKLSKNKKNIKVSYEATHIGFTLCRDLRKEGILCHVIAPHLIPKTKGAMVKTDKKDAKNLAILSTKGLLTEVDVPTEEDENDRDLVRSRSFLVNEIKSIKNYISSLCKRHDIDFKKETGMANFWTGKYRIWLDSKVKHMAEGSLKITLRTLLSSIIQLEGNLEYCTEEIEKLSREKKYKAKVDALKVYRGIETITAIQIVTEIRDIKRFATPKQLASYLRLEISEYSSGGKERKYGITKSGNKVLRTALVEANQSSWKAPKVSRWLQKRREGINPELSSIADRCMKRLYKKANRLIFRGKPKNKVKVACAREMVGFVWESLNYIAGTICTN